MAGRVKRNALTNPDFERLGYEIEDVRQAVSNLSNTMMMDNMGNSIDTPEPEIPFRIFERLDVDGPHETFGIKVPEATRNLRVLLINYADNRKKSTDADDASAILRARRKVKHFRFTVSEDEATNGTLERETDTPLKKKKNNTDNRWQLIRLVALNDTGAFAFNPDDNPFNATGPFNVGDQIFPALVVRNQYDSGDTGHNPGDTITDDNDQRFFNVGTAVLGPSAPAANLIVGNAVNLETQAADAKVTFKIWANSANNGSGTDVSFEDAGFNEAHIVLQRINLDGSADPASGGTNDEPLKFGGPIGDVSQTFILIDANLPLGARFKWKKNTLGNGHVKVPATPPSDVTFYAGGNPPTAGIPELTAFTISATQIDNAHTEVIITLTQPATPVLLKRIQLFKTLPSGTKKLIEKIPLLDEESVFVASASTQFVRELKHKANLTGIKYDATVIGINHTTAVPIKRDATQATADSTFSVAPSGPDATRLSTAPDDDTGDGNDAYADFTVFASGADSSKTFADTGCDHIAIVLRKNNSAADDDPDDARIPKYIFPIEDPTVTNAVFRVRGLHLGRQYIWRKVIGIRSGINIKVVGSVSFRAGQMALSPANVDLSLVALPENKRNAKLSFYVGNQASPAVLLKNVEIWQDIGDGAGFQEIRQRRLKDRSEFQQPRQTGTGTISSVSASQTVNGSGTSFTTQLAAGYIIIANGQVRVIQQITSATSLLTDQPFSPAISAGTAFAFVAATARAHFKVHIPPMKTVQYFARLRAVGNLTKDSATITQNGMGVPEPPTDLPTIPAATEIVANTVIGDMTHGHARVTFRVYADWSKTKTFDQVMADSAYVVIIDSTDGATSERYKIGGVIQDTTQTFVDIEATVLTAGKSYKWRKNITTRNGAPAKSQNGDVAFTAGGSVGTAGLPELTNVTFTLNPVLDAAGVADSRHLDAILMFTQPNPQILIKRVKVEKSINGGTFMEAKARRLLDEPAYQTPGAVPPVLFQISHPKNSSVSVRCTIIAVGGNTRVLTVSTTSANETIPGPVVAPSAPASLFLVGNTIQGDTSLASAKVTFRVYASLNQNASFATVGVDAVHVVVVDGGDGSTSERYKFGGPIKDNTQTFVDIEASTLVLGKSYKWRQNISSKNGVQSQSTVNDISFTAGGKVSTSLSSDLGNRSIALSSVIGSNGKADSRHSDVVLSFTNGAQQIQGSGVITVGAQSLSVNGTGTQFTVTFKVGDIIVFAGIQRQIALITSDATLTIASPFGVGGTNSAYFYLSSPALLRKVILYKSIQGGAYTQVKERRLLDDPTYQTTGTKTVQFQVNHPKNSTVAVQARIVGVGDGVNAAPFVDVFSSSQTSAEDVGLFQDNGAPSSGSGTKLRWRKESIRVAFIIPRGSSNNMNTHSTNKLLFWFTINGTPNFAYLWDPLQRITFGTSYTGFFNPLNPLNTEANYLIDIGKTGIVTLLNRIPTSTNGAEPNSLTEIDANDSSYAVYNGINTNGGFLYCAFYVFNRFNDTDTGSQTGAYLILQINSGFAPIVT